MLRIIETAGEKFAGGSHIACDLSNLLVDRIEHPWKDFLIPLMTVLSQFRSVWQLPLHEPPS